MDAQGQSGDAGLSPITFRVDPGQVVRLSGGRNTSSRGGAYTCVPADEAHRFRIIHGAGVTVLDPENWPALADNLLTLAEAQAMDDEELSGLPGIGPATLKKIREAAPPGAPDEETTDEE